LNSSNLLRVTSYCSGKSIDANGSAMANDSFSMSESTYAGNNDSCIGAICVDSSMYAVRYPSMGGSIDAELSQGSDLGYDCQ
jgi:hypothetical protein